LIEASHESLALCEYKLRSQIFYAQAFFWGEIGSHAASILPSYLKQPKISLSAACPTSMRSSTEHRRIDNETANSPFLETFSYQSGNPAGMGPLSHLNIRALLVGSPNTCDFTSW
jgi:hypothetical protein